jgi:hypothetical protein
MISTPSMLECAPQAAQHGQAKSPRPPQSCAPPQAIPGNPRRERLLAACSALRTLVRVAAVVTAVFALSLWTITIIPAIALAVLYGLLILCRHRAGRALELAPADSQQRSTADRMIVKVTQAVVVDPPPVSEPALLVAEEKAGAKVALGIFGSLTIIAIVLASIVLDWRWVAVGGLVIFCYLCLLGGPFWLAAIEEDVEQTHEDLTGEHRAIH